MKLKYVFLLFIFIIVSLQVSFTFFSAYTNFETRKNSLLYSYQSQLDKIFDVHKAHLLGNIIIGNEILLRKDLLNLANQENIHIHFSGYDYPKSLDSERSYLKRKYVLRYLDRKYGEVVFSKEINIQEELSFESLFILIFPQLLITVIVMTAFYYWFRGAVSYPFDAIKAILIDSPESHDRKGIIFRSSDISKLLIDLKKILREYESQVRLKESQVASTKLAKQVAHDIRSPAEALRSVVSNLENVDYLTREIIVASTTRITSIANSLLRLEKENQEKKEFSLLLLLKRVVQDKQSEHQSKVSTTINVGYRESFIYGNETDIYRCLSNIINNAIEAQSETQSKKPIEISINKDIEIVTISISDEGPGITEDKIEKIMAGGVTSKKNGNGIGVHSSKVILESHNGQLKIKSLFESGTVVLLQLPIIVAPRWAKDKVNISQSTKRLICIDDDQSYLEAYKKKFIRSPVPSIYLNEKEVRHFQFLEDDFIFIDYDLGNNLKGTQIIEEKEIGDRCILVTSMYLDADVQNYCNKNDVGLIPKQILFDTEIFFS